MGVVAVVTTGSGCPVYVYICPQNRTRWDCNLGSNLSMDFYCDCRGTDTEATPLPVIYVHRIVILIPPFTTTAASFGVRPRESCPRSLVADEEEDDARHVMILINILIYAIDRPLLLPPCRLHFTSSGPTKSGRHGV